MTKSNSPIKFELKRLTLSPRMRAAIRHEAALLSQHPDNAAIDEWIEAAYDLSDWPFVADYEH